MQPRLCEQTHFCSQGCVFPGSGPHTGFRFTRPRTPSFFTWAAPPSPGRPVSCFKPLGADAAPIGSNISPQIVHCGPFAQSCQTLWVGGRAPLGMIDGVIGLRLALLSSHLVLDRTLGTPTRGNACLSVVLCSRLHPNVLVNRPLHRLSPRSGSSAHEGAQSGAKGPQQRGPA